MTLNISWPVFDTKIKFNKQVTYVKYVQDRNSYEQDRAEQDVQGDDLTHTLYCASETDSRREEYNSKSDA